MARPANGAPIRKLSQEEYVDLRTGEVKQFERNERKQRENLRETFRNLTGLIRANFDADNNGRQVFITLTYRENMQDHKRLMEDYKLFWKKLKYYCKGHKMDYIAVAEPQERGAWHMHVMVKSDRKLFIPKEKIGELWGHGMTRIDALVSDDVGRYYVAYFTDLFGEFGETAKKKGGRLPLYPVGMKFYRCSRGIVRPEASEGHYREIVESWGRPSYREAYEVQDAESGETIQTVQREHFKR